MVYIQPFSITFTTAYVQPLGIKYISAPYTTLALNAISADYIQPLMRPADPVVYHLPSASWPSAASITINIGHGKELFNLAKIYTNNTKYCGGNNSFTFKLAVFHDICFRADGLPKAKIKAFLTMFKGLGLDNYLLNIGISSTIIYSN